MPIVAYETAKTELAQAVTMPQRFRAVEKAIALGMPLDLIEAYLDWLDVVRPLPHDASLESAVVCESLEWQTVPRVIVPDAVGNADAPAATLPAGRPESDSPRQIE